MPEFSALSQQVEFLKVYGSDLASRVRELVAVENVQMLSGERHGSWFLRARWQEGPLVKAAEIALTSASALPDDLASTAVVSVRASATSESRYVVETLYERRRGVSRVSSADLTDWLMSAAQRAADYTSASLVSTYSTGAIRSDI